MEKLNFNTPLFTFDSSHLSTTAPKDCYLYGSITDGKSGVGSNATATIKIGSITDNYVITNGATYPVETLKVYPQLIPQGTTIEISGNGLNIGSMNLYLLDTL